MACAATDFDACFMDGTFRLKNISVENQPPPILFYPEDLWPIVTKGYQEYVSSSNDTGIVNWLKSQMDGWLSGEQNVVSA